MKIEKISENQIRCTLTREDLTNRQIRLSELAYGSPKAKELFHEMMQQAAASCGFKADNMPLMIEAIPTSPDSLVLLITKVDDPDVLDSRFSRFSPDEGGSYESPVGSAQITGADNILDLLSKLGGMGSKGAAPKAAPADTGAAAPQSSAAPQASPSPAKATADTATDPGSFTTFYLFHDLEDLIEASHLVHAELKGPSSLFRNPEDGNYFLILKKGDTEDKAFNRLCNVLSEYALQADYMVGMEEYFTEHLKVITRGDALEKLSAL